MADGQSGQGSSGGSGGDGKTSNPVPNANIALRKEAKPITVDGEVNFGMSKNPILFPSEAAQRTGWYHPRASEILALFGDRYIAVTPKG